MVDQNGPHRGPAFLLFALMLCSSGCGLWQPSQLTQCQAEKKKILARAVSKERELDELLAERKRLGERLADAEKQLAQLSDSTGNRLADRRNSTEFRAPAGSQPPRVEEPRYRRETAVPNEWSARPKKD